MHLQRCGIQQAGYAIEGRAPLGQVNELDGFEYFFELGLVGKLFLCLRKSEQVQFMALLKAERQVVYFELIAPVGGIWNTICEEQYLQNTGALCSGGLF